MGRENDGKALFMIQIIPPHLSDIGAAVLFYKPVMLPMACCNLLMMEMLKIEGRLTHKKVTNEGS